MAPALVQILVLFAEPGFPAIDVSKDLIQIPGAVVATSVAQLDEALKPGRVLVWRHGSAFPADAWPALIRFLEQGGSLLYLGGEPFTRPVTGPPGKRAVQPRTVSMLKELRLNQCYRLEVGGATLRHAGGGVPDRTLGDDARASILEPRFTDSKLFENEDGSWGPREAVLRPLSHLYRRGADERFPCAAGSYAIDRLSDRFAGGRWVFHLISTPPTEAELASLLSQAARPAADFRVDPTLGCYHEGETPAVTLSIHVPVAIGEVAFSAAVEVRHPDGRRTTVDAGELRGMQRASAVVRLEGATTPGLYRVTATIEGVEPVETGFWVFDRTLFESGGELSFDGYTLRRDGEPEPVVGTTVMSETVHRDFLFEPNAAVWDDTFAELASLNINLVRTGMWGGYRKICRDGGVDEAWLRALEAYYLSARKHGVPVLFTFFAFIPEAYGGMSPYFDPASLATQRAYLAGVASRFAGAKEMLWDLINEPSFASAHKLWTCKPNEDAFETEAFRSWLQGRYGGGTEAGRADWESRVRARWRLLPDEPIGVPTDDDFVDVHLLGDRRPYRARDFVHFAQDAFAAWAADMSRAIRGAGSPTAITVGQDEGGLYDRPHPLLHHHVLDYTSIHTWWTNDGLLWDGVMAKAPGKPLLASETGIMGRELLSGESQRGETARAELLSRKIAYAFAAGAFGSVQWCYEVNPYMDLDNEVAIGLKRVDGSYKPEHRVMRDFAAFVARNAHRFELAADDPLALPQVVLVLPSGDHFPPRGMQSKGTRRIVQVVMEELGVPLQVVSEYRTRTDLGKPKLIILPSCRGISEGAWRDIVAAVEGGATLHCSGWFETDDANLPAGRLGGGRRALSHAETISTREHARRPAVLRFPLDATQSWYAADHGAMPRIVRQGAGQIRHFALPIDWAEPHIRQARHYAESLDAANVGRPDPTPCQQHAGVLVRAVRMRDVDLVVAINETPIGRRVPLPPQPPHTGGSTTRGWVPASMANMFIVDRDGQLLDSLYSSR